MANTYTQLYFHIVFAVKGRANSISLKWREQLYKYITGIITNKNQKLIIINGNLSDLVRDIKANSSKFINDQKWVMGKFEWQTGFGAFSLGHSQLDTAVAYIKNQEKHHKTKTFREEYLDFLKRYEIDFKSEYIFKEN